MPLSMTKTNSYDPFSFRFTPFIISGRLYLKRDQIEAALAQQERTIYGLKEKIILYDLTNTYLAGTAMNSEVVLLPSTTLHLIVSTTFRTGTRARSCLNY